MKIYHIAYEPTYKSIDFHIWVPCNLGCLGCYTQYEQEDFGLLDDPIAEIGTKKRRATPERFLSLEEVKTLVEDKEIKYALFLGTEASLDPELPELAKWLHHRFNSYNMLLTNGLKLVDMSDIDEVIFSIKAVSEDIHKQYTGKSNTRILEHFKEMYASGIKMQAETVVVPGLIEADEIGKTAAFIASVDKDITLRVDAYFAIPNCPWTSATNTQVEDAARVAEKYLNNVSILTLDMKRIGEKAVKVF